MNEKMFLIFELLFSVFPVKRNRILFLSFGGQFNDNPLYIYKALCQYKHLDFFWVISEKSKERNFPDNIKIVRYHSIKHAYISRTAKVIVDNGAGYKNVMKKKSIFNIIYKLYKRKQQFNLSTWHGTPMKKIGINIPNTSHEFCFSTTEMMIAGCKYTKRILSQSFPFNIPVILTGTPRNDILFNTNKELETEIRRKLNIIEDCKVVLYAPTYRENPEYSGFAQMEEMDIKKLLCVLSEKFGGQWVFAYRIHQMSLAYTDMRIKDICSDANIVDANKIDDMAECLFITDVLITDFSGALYDYSLTKKPCFLYAIDLLNYKNERGFNQEPEDFPFPFSHSFYELLNNIKQFDSVTYKEKVEKFLEDIGNREEGNASERISKIILKKINVKYLDIYKSKN